jgi:hypothetical protein
MHLCCQTEVFMVCAGADRRGAIYWVRRRLQIATGKSVAVARSLRVTDPAQTRRLGETAHMAAASLAQICPGEKEAHPSLEVCNRASGCE